MSKPTHVTHAEHVRVSLEQDIFMGRLRPGSRLDEEVIANRFGVSRTPVREAVLQLVESGLVEKRPRQGAVVASMDIRRMIHMFEVMSELEGLCAKLSARRMSPEEKAKLAEVHKQSEDHYNAGRQDEYYAASRKFHQLLVWGSHNDVLVEMTDKLALQLVPYRRYQLNYPGRAEENLRDHAAIMEAVQQGDPEIAYRRLRQHTTIQGDIFAEYISLTGQRAAE